MPLNDHVNGEAVLAEYSAVRAEIEQLNGQIFSVLSGSLALDLSVLGWLFGGPGDPRARYFLPTVGILFLMAGNYILLNRNRGAHRLALFQKHFVEPRLPDICWGRVYFEYRTRYSETSKTWAKKRLESMAERLANSGSWVLVGASALNIVILAILGLAPYFASSPAVVDRAQLANFVVASALVASEVFLLPFMTDYKKVEEIMKGLAKEAGLTPPQS